MHDDAYAAYREFLAEGSRIEIGIPLSGGGVFRDWAIIKDSDGDELLAQISRDVLPANVRLAAGSIVDVTIRAGDEAYTCSGIITDKDDARTMRIRLFGLFTLQERRQFFRIELGLRLKYAFIGNEASRTAVERDWVQRRDLELMKYQGYDEFVIAARKAHFVPAIKLEWRDLFDPEINLSGGGMSFTLPDRVQPDELLALEIFLPLVPPRQIHCVAQALHVRKRNMPNGEACYRAGFHFVFLDERDRDLLFSHISSSQLAVLRALADRRELPAEESALTAKPALWQRVLLYSLVAILLLILSFYLVRYLIDYSKHGSPNQIQQTYEKSIKQYRHESR